MYTSQGHGNVFDRLTRHDSFRPNIKMTMINGVKNLHLKSLRIIYLNFEEK